MKPPRSQSVFKLVDLTLDSKQSHNHQRADSQNSKKAVSFHRCIPAGKSAFAMVLLAGFHPLEVQQTPSCILYLIPTKEDSRQLMAENFRL